VITRYTKATGYMLIGMASAEMLSVALCLAVRCSLRKRQAAFDADGNNELSYDDDKSPLLPNNHPTGGSSLNGNGNGNNRTGTGSGMAFGGGGGGVGSGGGGGGGGGGGSGGGRPVLSQYQHVFEKYGLRNPHTYDTSQGGGGGDMI
jgi:hypothetical protein